MLITNCTALVTGANRGLGRAITTALLESGAAKVYAAGRHPEALADLQSHHPGRLETLLLDITNPTLVAEVATRCADTSLLINNAGVNRMQGFISAGSIDDARLEMETNYFGTLAMCQAFAPVLKSNGGGAIVNVLSILAKITLPAMGSLCASKAAGLRLTEGLRAELAASGTQVTALMTGALDTDMSRDFDGPKSEPNAVAASLIEGLVNGKTEVYFGEMCDWINDALVNDPDALQKEFAQFLPVN